MVLLVSFTIILYNFIRHGFSWPLGNVISWILVTIGVAVYGLVAGNMREINNQLEQAHITIQKQALTDSVTGLPNHRAVIEQLEKEFERTRRFHRSLSLVFFDGDRFKKVNDMYGHAVGDIVLHELGARVSNVLRGGDTLGRFGGEEFVVLLPETDALQSSEVAERIRAAVAVQPFAIPSVEGGIILTISVGIATYPGDGETIRELMEKVDQAMYWSKRLGRNQVRTVAESQQCNYSALLDILDKADEARDEMIGSMLHAERLQRAYYLGTIYSLMRMIEVRDAGISRHSHIVSDLSTAIAQHIGLEQHTIFALGTAALLHDIGKVAIPDALLYKTRPLTPAEQLIIQQHSELGAQILEISPFLQKLIPAIRHHHERWDGKGYPDHLAGHQIPLEARIITVAEAYDSMIMNHPYRVGCSPMEALAELKRCAGKQFDPEIVDAFVKVMALRQEQEQTPQVILPLEETNALESLSPLPGAF